MKIAVLVKQVPDTWGDRDLSLDTGLLVRDADSSVPDEIGERALENALRYKDDNPDTEIVLLTLGPEIAETALRKLLAMGPDSAVHVVDPAFGAADMVATSRVLAAALERISPDLVVAGNESTDGRGGIVPAMIAEIHQIPILPNLDEVTISATGVRGRLQSDGAVIDLETDLPAIVTVTEKSAEQRLPNFKGVLQAKKKPLEKITAADLGDVAATLSGTAQSVMVSATKRPPKQAGPRIEDDGTAAEQLATFLAENRLI